MARHTFTMEEDKAALVHSVVSDHTKALKNWIAMAVERNETERAQTLVKELRQYEELYKAFNTEAWHTIAKHTGKEIELNHHVF